MFKIDIHTHILPKTLPRFMDRFGYGGFIQVLHDSNSNSDSCCGGQATAQMVQDNGTFFRTITSNCWDPQVRIQECDALGVNVQVLSTLPVMFCYWAKPQDNLEVARFLNDHLADIVSRYPKRFVGLGTVPLQDQQLATRELNRCMQELKLKGVQIGSHIGKINLDDPTLHPFYAEAERLQASLFIHPWDMMGLETMPKYWLPWLVSMPAETSRAICSMIFGGIFVKFPKLKVAFAHGGGSFPGTLGRIEHGFMARPDLCAQDNPLNPKESLGKFYFDSLVHDPKTLKFLIDLVGANRIALGSDYPFPLGEARPGQMIDLMEDLSMDTKESLFSQSALSWLGMNKSQFL